MAKRVLVTGGAGFLGSHLCTALLERGCEVLCVDNFFTGARGNIDPLRDHPRFEIMRHDMILPLYVEVDEIYNLACPASPVHYQHDPVHTTKTSVHGRDQRAWARQTAEGPHPAGLDQRGLRRPRGPSAGRELSRLVNVSGPRACYDEGKRCAETLFYDYYRQHNLEIQHRPHLQYLRAEYASE